MFPNASAAFVIVMYDPPDGERDEFYLGASDGTFWSELLSPPLPKTNEAIFHNISASGELSAEVLALKHKSRILRQWSNPVSATWFGEDPIQFSMGQTAHILTC